MGKFVVRERSRSASAAPEYLVVNLEDRGRPVAAFASRADADAHAEKLNAGPLDWDQQDAWQDDDDWEEDDDGAADGSV